MGGSRLETRSTPGPPLPCPLTPAARRERGFSLLHTLPCALISPDSPSMPRSLRASLKRGCAPRETSEPPREKPPCPPLPGRAASLCAAPARRDSSSAIRLELPSPGFVPPAAPRVSRAGWIQPHHPCGAGQPSAGLDGSGWVAKDAQSLPCSRSCDPSSRKLRCNPIPARPHAHPQSRLQCARHPSLLLSSSRSAECGVPWERSQAGSG